MLVLQLPPLEASLGGRLLLHPALAGNPGGALGAEVCGDVAGQAPLRREGSVATSHHALQQNTHSRYQHNTGPVASLPPTRGHLEWLVSAVGQHVSLQPALTGGRCVVNLTAFPQTHKHL